MTDTTTVDLAAWLTGIWDEEERLAESTVGDVAAMEIDNYGHLTVPAHWVLARIAADRKILELHGPNADLCFWTNTGPTTHSDYGRDGWDAEPHEFVCDTLKALASPYKGREGWQEAWGHE